MQNVVEKQKNMVRQRTTQAKMRKLNFKTNTT